MSRSSSLSFRLIAVVAGVFIFASSQAAEADAELENVRKVIGEKFEMIKPEDVNKSQVDGWYEIQSGSIVAYVSADGRYLMQGDMIDLNASVNLSEQARTNARRALMSSVSDDQTIAFTPHDVKYSVSVFTDVECTYCRRLHSQIDEYLALGIEVRYLMYPRNGPASKAWSTAEHVWCSADRKNALTMAKQGREVSAANCDASIVQQQYVLGHEVGLSGTPAIVLQDGTLIGGYVAPEQLAATLAQNASK